MSLNPKLFQMGSWKIRGHPYGDAVLRSVELQFALGIEIIEKPIPLQVAN